jgi:hypothetical protein
MKLVINYDINLYKIVEKILLEKILKSLVAVDSWQIFKLMIVAKRDLSEEPK